MNKPIILPILLCFALILFSCSNNDNNPTAENIVGNILILSAPDSAQIWLDGVYSGKVTPDTLTNVSVGNHTIILKLSNYFNDTIAINVQEGLQTLDRLMVIDKSLTVYGPIQIWENLGTSISRPSGIILKTGRSSSISSGNIDSVDIYYSSNGFVVTSAFNINSRATTFFIGLSTNLEDNISSPQAIPNWLTQVLGSEQNYFFLFDADSHYSKMIIKEKGGTQGSTSDPSWIKVQWVYNNKTNDPRF